jgi:hypothetical protein
MGMRDFCFWLQGFLADKGPGTGGCYASLSGDKVMTIKNKLAEVLAAPEAPHGPFWPEARIGLAPPWGLANATSETAGTANQVSGGNHP